MRQKALGHARKGIIGSITVFIFVAVILFITLLVLASLNPTGNLSIVTPSPPALSSTQTAAPAISYGIQSNVVFVTPEYSEGGALVALIVCFLSFALLHRRRQKN
jgi:hypothetical protein